MGGATVPAWARRSAARPGTGAADGPAGPRLVLVGPCASGKSTLAAALTADGYAVRICAQEHSEVPHLWALSDPDAVIFLSVDLDTVRRRRGNPSWSATIFRQQQRRLQAALAGCAIYLDTSDRSPANILALARTALAAAGFTPPSEPA